MRRRRACYLDPEPPAEAGRRWRSELVELVCGLNRRAILAGVRNDGLIWCADELHRDRLISQLAEIGIGAAPVDDPPASPKTADRVLFFLSQALTS